MKRRKNEKASTGTIGFPYLLHHSPERAECIQQEYLQIRDSDVVWPE